MIGYCRKYALIKCFAMSSYLGHVVVKLCIEEKKIYVPIAVFNHCISDLLPMNYECSLRAFNGGKGRFIRSVDDTDKCERVEPAKRKVVKKKFEIAESYLGRFIANILRHFTVERDVLGVR